MDDDLDSFEDELKRLRPRALPLPLVEHIGRDLHLVAAPPRRFSTAANWTSWKWTTWAASAAALVVMAGLMQLTPVPPTAEHASRVANLSLHAEDGELKPVAAESVLYDAREEGLVTLDDGRTARRVRQRYLDTITWRDAGSKRSLRWTLPREEVRVVPIVFQ